MKQSRRMSAVESGANILVGVVVAFSTQVLVFPLFGLQASASDHLAITLIFTAVSFARSYVLRRVFEGLRA